MKLYFIKIIKSLFLLVVLYIFDLVTTPVLLTLFYAIFKNDFTVRLFQSIIEVIFLSAITYYLRQRKTSQKIEYLNYMRNNKYTFKKDITYLIKNKELKAEAASCITGIIPLIIYIVFHFNLYKINITIAIFTSLVSSIMLFCIFIALDLLDWHFVHNKWMNDSTDSFK